MKKKIFISFVLSILVLLLNFSITAGSDRRFKEILKFKAPEARQGIAVDCRAVAFASGRAIPIGSAAAVASRVATVDAEARL